MLNFTLTLFISSIYGIDLELKRYIEIPDFLIN